MNRNKGFTLIELLVVIAIIGFLSSIVIGAVSSARAKAVDRARVSDMINIRNALFLYAADNGGMYPYFDNQGITELPNANGGYGDANCSNGWQTGNRASTFQWLEVLETGGYISKVPVERYGQETCNYAYVNFQTGAGGTPILTACGSPTGRYAVLRWHETTTDLASSVYKQPDCWAALNWTEGTPANPTSRMMILPQ